MNFLYPSAQLKGSTQNMITKQTMMVKKMIERVLEVVAILAGQWGRVRLILDHKTQTLVQYGGEKDR